mgnify:CR=1 FL=1
MMYYELLISVCEVKLHGRDSIFLSENVRLSKIFENGSELFQIENLSLGTVVCKIHCDSTIADLFIGGCLLDND